MSKRLIVVLGVIGVLALVFALVPNVVLAKGGPGEKGRGGSDGYRDGAGGYPEGYVVDSLDPLEEQALLMALDDEYKALATYLGVMDQFGQVDPFIAIARSEEQHIAALERLFVRYGLALPENGWIGATPAFDSVADACVAAAQAEVDNAALYDQLFSMVDNRDILRVFTRLHDASEYNHLPAFSSCEDNDGVYVPPSTDPGGSNPGSRGFGGRR